MLSVRRITVLTAGAVAAAAAFASAGCAPVGGDPYGSNPAPAGNPQAPAPAEDPSADPAAPKQNVAGVRTTKLVAKNVEKMGKVVTDSKGWTLYRFDKDSKSPPTSNCVDECAEKWPPVLTDGNPTLSKIDVADVGTVDREDGSKQLTLGGWPLYRFAADKKAGKWKGQGVGGTWYVAAPDGAKNLSCLPEDAANAQADDNDAYSDDKDAYSDGEDQDADGEDQDADEDADNEDTGGDDAGSDDY